MNNSINIANSRKLYHFLKYEVDNLPKEQKTKEEVECNIFFWMPNFLAEWDCGTAACVAGSYAIMEHGIDKARTMTAGEMMREMRDYLEISDSALGALVNPLISKYSSGKFDQADLTKEHAMKVLQHLGDCGMRQMLIDGDRVHSLWIKALNGEI